MTEARLQGDSLLAKGDAMSFLLLKTSRRKRSLRNYHRLLRLQQQKLEPQIKEFLNWMIKQLQAGLPKMRGRTTTAKVRSIADWKKIREEGLLILRPAIFEVLTAGGNTTHT